MDTVGVQVLLILALTAVGGYFAAAEIALISARRAALQQRAEEGSSGAKTALKLIEDPTRLLSTIQICITVGRLPGGLRRRRDPRQAASRRGSPSLGLAVARQRSRPDSRWCS